jgi:hypothetical protein
MMRSQRSILSLRWTPVSAPGGVRKAIGGFLRYVQYRDHHADTERPREVAGLLRYVAWRDAAAPQGRLFTEHGLASDRDRLAIGDYVAKSIAELEEVQNDTRWPRRACYRMVLSPEDARGLDLRAITREALAQLERDAGCKLPPWIAAEHRNTAHPHTHVVLPARRGVEPGRFRTVLITRRRLERMKVAMRFEIARQRGERVASLEKMLRQLDRRGTQIGRRAGFGQQLARFAGRIARGYMRQAERVARERDLSLQREDPR